MIDVKYYMVTLVDNEEAFQRSPGHTTQLVVGMGPTEWFVVTERYKLQAMVNFWEIKESTFGEFPHDLQNAAWDDYHQYSDDEN